METYTFLSGVINQHSNLRLRSEMMEEMMGRNFIQYFPKQLTDTVLTTSLHMFPYLYFYFPYHPKLKNTRSTIEHGVRK